MLVLAVLVPVAYGLVIGRYVYDDAYINLRYADHLIGGHGLVYNLGERVEGFTSLGWVLLLAMLRAVGLAPETVLLLAPALGGLATLAVVGLLWRGRDRGAAPFAGDVTVAGTWLLATSAPFLALCQGGMDAILAAAIVGLLVYLHRATRADAPAGRHVCNGVVATVLYLVRPELGLVGVVLGLDRLLRRQWRAASVYGVTATVLIVAHIGWRLVYYGDYAPNTAHAKADSFGEYWVGGVMYAAALVVWNAWPVFLWATVGAVRAARRGDHVLWAVPAAIFAFAVGVGGDYMPGYRFLIPAMPLVCLLAADTVRRAGPWMVAATAVLLVLQVLAFEQDGGMPFARTTGFERYALLLALPAVAAAVSAWGARALLQRPVAVGLCAFAAVWSLVAMQHAPWISAATPLSTTAHVTHMVRLGMGLEDNARAIGGWLRDYDREHGGGTVLAVNAAGAIPYFSGLPTIDMLGLTDAHIGRREMPGGGPFFPGHQKCDGVYVLGREPDIIVFGQQEGQRMPVFPGDRELFEQTGFTERYRFREVPMQAGPRRITFRFWERN